MQDATFRRYVMAVLTRQAAWLEGLPAASVLIALCRAFAMVQPMSGRSLMAHKTFVYLSLRTPEGNRPSSRPIAVVRSHAAIRYGSTAFGYFPTTISCHV